MYLNDLFPLLGKEEPERREEDIESPSLIEFLSIFDGIDQSRVEIVTIAALETGLGRLTGKSVEVLRRELRNMKDKVVERSEYASMVEVAVAGMPIAAEVEASTTLADQVTMEDYRLPAGESLAERIPAGESLAERSGWKGYDGDVAMEVEENRKRQATRGAGLREVFSALPGLPHTRQGPVSISGKPQSGEESDASGKLASVLVRDMHGWEDEGHTGLHWRGDPTETLADTVITVGGVDVDGAETGTSDEYHVHRTVIAVSHRRSVLIHDILIDGAPEGHSHRMRESVNISIPEVRGTPIPIIDA